MSQKKVIEATQNYVKVQLRLAEGGHDWFHILRVYHTAMHIAAHEQANNFVVALAALLHDIADSKFHEGDESIGPKMARAFLIKQNVDSEIVEHVAQIIEYMSFKNSFDSSIPFSSLEMKIVQDADRLDALGAIGIARCFNYGGFKNNPIYDPEIPPNLHMTKSEYKSGKGTSINHFYEKLLLLKDEMQTRTGQQMAQKRHDFMLSYLKQFYAEWNGEH